MTEQIDNESPSTTTIPPQLTEGGGKGDVSDELSASVRAKIDRVFEEHGLSAFGKLAAWKWVGLMGEREDLARAREWLRHHINKTKPHAPPKQQGCPDIVPGLRAQPWWPNSEFPFISEIESNYPQILAELTSLKGSDSFHPFRQPKWTMGREAKDKIGAESHDQGGWNVFYLYLHEFDCKENRERCPHTVKLIENLKGGRHYSHAFFSAVTPGTHIIPHHGPTNKKLRVHLALGGVDASRIRVGDEIREWKVGECFVFDDSFEHEVWHDGVTTRVILIFDIWHPDLTNDEVKFLGYMHRAKMRAEKKAAESLDEFDDSNFFHLLEQTRELKVKDADWWDVPPVSNQQQQ